MLTEATPLRVAPDSDLLLQAVHCTHCGLPVPHGLIRPGTDGQFCCHGCEAVFSVIQKCGLGRYYALREASSANARPPRASGRKFAEFDDAVFHRLFVKDTPRGLQSVDLYVEGVHCGACVWLLERLPRIAPGVIDSRLDLRRSLLHIEWSRSEIALSTIAAAIESLGYVPHAARDVSMRAARRVEERRQLIRLGVAGACAGNVMLLAAAMYAGLLDGMDQAFANLFRWFSMCLTVISVAGPGAVFFRSAMAAIRTHTLHLDVPIALGLGAGLVWGIVNTLGGAGEVYFDSLSVLVFALLLGRWVQRRQQHASADAMELLYSLTPSRARLVLPGADPTEVAVESIMAGQIVEVLAGDSVPVDGEIICGTTCIDESLLTGESVPVHACPGFKVTAGAVNVSAAIRVRVEATGGATRLGRIARLVEECSQRRGHIVRTADRLAGWFVVAMLVLSMVTVAVWLWLDPSRAIENAVALLIVTCPCALGLATPLAVTAAIGKAAKRGILIKGGDVLERLARPGTILLDKTGTITRGRLSVVQFRGCDGIKPLVAALESQSSHPIALAIARDFGTSPLAATDVDQTPGGGISGCVDGHLVSTGSPAFVFARADSGTCSWEAIASEMCDAGWSPVLVAVDGKIKAVLGIGDAIRDDASAAIRALQVRGWRVGILSGDNAAVVRAIGDQLKLEASQCRGAATPEDKLEVVRTLLHDGPVVMVGDGVNDAAALAAATVGIAVHGGAEASLAAADVYLNRPGLMPVVEVIKGASRTVHVIKRNLLISLIYNALAAALAVTGIIHPLIAAILMPISSLSVVAMSYRSRTFGGEQ